MQVKVLEDIKELNAIFLIDGEKTIKDIIDQVYYTYSNYDEAKEYIFKVVKSLYFKDAVKLR